MAKTLLMNEKIIA